RRCPLRLPLANRSGPRFEPAVENPLAALQLAALLAGEPAPVDVELIGSPHSAELGVSVLTNPPGCLAPVGGPALLSQTPRKPLLGTQLPHPPQGHAHPLRRRLDVDPAHAARRWRWCRRRGGRVVCQAKSRQGAL